MRIEEGVSIENPKRPRSGSGISLGYTRVQGPGGECIISTIQHPLGKWYETVAFSQSGQSVDPLVTSTVKVAESVHEFIVRVAAQILR